VRTAEPVSTALGGPSARTSPGGWLRRYAQALLLVDATALALTGAVALLARFGADDAGTAGLGGISYIAIAAALAVLWLGVLGMSRCYETRFLGTGPEEYRRVANASFRLTAVVALVAFAAQLALSRGFLAAFLVVGTALLLAGRLLARAYLRRGRRDGRFRHRVLVVGGAQQASELAGELSRDPLAGLEVVGACVAGRTGRLEFGRGSSVPVLGGLTSVTRALRDVDADTVAVAAGPGISGEALRRLSYDLEGTDIDLLVAPALTSITGTRVQIRPMAGLPLLHLDEPELSGARQVAKAVFDLAVAVVLVLVLLPLLVGIAVVVRLGSPGPALFGQERVGRHGRPFRVYKFRSMYTDAEQRLAEITHLNEHDGVLFKVRNDPRVTPVGRWLRKYSLDELPQLLNVLKGDMSLVGPRPPLASEVARYEGHAHRRLLVRPGITGLWQVSGRSDLSWEDTVRLDLQYVEAWSLALDVTILLRTASAVLAGKGAY
jgi:exopolysaccharide biosynthesis polyprenyl glycosylphosphotransferase